MTDEVPKQLDPNSAPYLKKKLMTIHEIADMTLKDQMSLKPDLVTVARKRYDALLEIRGLSKID